ncbi:lipopolysaccharide biosynthesis protein [Gillisia sp. Q332]|uniref:lipopolysaccharide biosynthesis protein n=1 Tax=Gillisia xinjiangensis TaxID=3384765 RepID=UPI0039194ECD
MSLKEKAISGLIWTFAQQFGHQLIGFIVSVILARILLPAEFGLIGMISIFFGVGMVLLDGGLTQSLIRSKELDEDDYSTVFFFNLFASFVIYVIIYISAPLIGNFYDQPILITVIRLYCLTFIISGFGAVQQARLTKNMEFRVQALMTVPATLIGGGVGVAMAYMGYGVFSLVWSQIVTSVISVSQLWFYTKWMPNLTFNFTKFKDHFNYGYKLTLSNLLNKIFQNLYIIIIGKYFSAAQVGFYTRADSTTKLPVTNISNALNKVTFPMFAAIQEDNVRLKRVYRQLMQMVVFVIAPILILMAVLAEPIFRFLFTEKWLPAVPYFQILCISGILHPVHTYNLNVLKVKGRSDLFLKISIINKVITIIGIIIGIQFGIFGLLYAQVIVSFTTFFLHAYYTDQFINYSAWEQIKDLIPIILLSLLCGGIILYLDLLLVNYLDFFRIITGLTVGGGVYFLLAWIFKFNSIGDLRKIVLKK